MRISGNEGSADQLRERVRHIFIKQLHGSKVTAADQRTSFGQIRQVVLREILQLDVTTGKTTGAIGPIELEHASGMTVIANGVFLCLIFLSEDLASC